MGGMSQSRQHDSGDRKKMKISGPQSVLLKVHARRIMLMTEWFSFEEMNTL